MENNRVLEILNELDFEKMKGEIDVLSQNDVKDVNKINEIIDRYARRIIDLTQNDNFSVKVVLLHKLRGTIILNHLLRLEDNETFIRAQLVLEYLKGNGIDVLLNKLDLAKKNIIEKKNSNSSTINKTYETLDILNEYLRSNDYETVLEKLIWDTNYFVCDLGDINQAFFTDDNDECLSLMVKNLFVTDYLLPEVSNHLYSVIVPANKYLQAYDFTKVIEEKPKCLTTIKGLYRRVNNDSLSFMLSNVQEKDYENFNNFFREIINLNQDDLKGLQLFFIQVDDITTNDNQFHDFLMMQDYYQKYVSISNKELYQRDIDELLSGNKDVDESFQYFIGKCDEYLDNYDSLLDLFINSYDSNYQKVAFIPLVMGLLEKQKRKYHLEFKTVLTTTILNDSTLAFYHREMNTLFINKNVLSNNELDEKFFVYACNTIFREIRQIKDYHEVKTSDEFSFNNLVMAMDYFLSSISEDYMKNNYRHLSFNRDANAISYVDTMTFFSKYPSMQEYMRKQRADDYHLSDYLRKETNKDNDIYYGIIFFFMKRIKVLFDYAKTNSDVRETVLRMVKTYPVLFKFFDIDLNNLTINIYNGEYYKDMLINNEESAYSVSAFLYALNVSRYLEKNEQAIRLKEEGYNKDLIEEIDKNVKK